MLTRIVGANFMYLFSAWKEDHFSFLLGNSINKKHLFNYPFNSTNTDWATTFPRIEKGVGNIIVYKNGSIKWSYESITTLYHLSGYTITFYKQEMKGWITDSRKVELGGARKGFPKVRILNWGQKKEQVITIQDSWKEFITQKEQCVQRPCGKRNLACFASLWS